MSGIAGVYLQDGAPVERALLTAMLERLAHRGPDGTDMFVSGSIGLGHCMLRTTPESLAERLPFTDARTGLAITADARIDNRDELMRSLAIERPAASVSDSELILAAYACWGEACLDKLLGDFSFAIWDARKRTLFCATDPMGVRTLYFFCAGDVFAFASEIKALACLPFVRRRLNEQRIVDHLAVMFEDSASTWYRDVQRLPGARAMVVSRDRIRQWQYWTLDPERKVRLASDAEYAEAFRGILGEAVRCRTRSAYPVGSTLSGGLDSSSIACLAQDSLGQSNPLHTFSLIFPSLPEAERLRIDERPLMRAVLDRGGFEPHFIRADELSPMGQIDRIHHHLDEPNGSPNLYLHWGIFGEARGHGVRVVLDGFDGDSAVSHGYDRLPDLVRTLRWRTAARELGLLARHQFSGSRRRDLIWNLFIDPLLSDSLSVVRARFGLRQFEVPLIDRAFALQVGAAERFREWDRPQSVWTSTSSQRHASQVLSGAFSDTLAVADRASAAFAVEARYPFFDRRLLEFCVALPPEQKFGDGWSRVVLRRAMAGILPDAVCWRPGKGDLGPNFRRGMLSTDKPTLERVILEGSPSPRPYVDVPAAGVAYRQFLTDPVGSLKESLALFRAVSLALWLQSTGVTA